MMGKINLAALLGVMVALVASVGAQECTGGISGIQSTSLDVCCTLECGTCGGMGCTPANTSSLTAGDCCATEIVESGVLCSVTNTAPCILTTEAAPATSTCENGQTGIQDPDTDVCCPLECGDLCGGDGCGTIPGVDADLCCATLIEESGRICGDTVGPPCSEVAVAVGDPVCSNGLPGVESDNLICCDAACGVCGGSTCGSVPGLTSGDCCTGTIATTGELCSVKGSAPCIVDPPEVTPSTCPNGLPGVADGSVCCAEACNGQCGGTGCGAIAGTNGAADCCSETILATANMCVDTAPCVMVNGTFTEAPAAAPTMAPGATMAPLAAGATLAPTVGSRDILVSMAPTPTSQTAAPTPTSMTAAPTMMPAMMTTAMPTSGSRDIDFGTGVPTMAPTSLEEAEASSMAPTVGSRDLDLGSVAPSAGSRDLGSMAPSAGSRDLGTMGPSGVTLFPGTLPPAVTAGSSALSAGSVVTVAAMLSGMFAVFAAARN